MKSIKFGDEPASKYNIQTPKEKKEYSKEKRKYKSVFHSVKMKDIISNYKKCKEKGRNLMIVYAESHPADSSGNGFLDIRHAIFTHMEPLLKKYNFMFSHDEKSAYIFRHIKNPAISVSFTVKPEERCIRCDLTRGNPNDLMNAYPLSLFVQGNSFFKGIKNHGFWYYGSGEELTAILEEQADLLVQFGFQWMFDHLKMELEEC